MFNKVLVPLDGSELAEQVLAPVTELVEAFGCEVSLLTVVEPGSDDDTRHVCEVYLATIRGRLRQRLSGAAPEVETVVLPGRSAHDIVEFAQQGDFDLVAMASRGRRGLESKGLGSTVDNVSRSLAVPSLIVRVKQPPHRVGKGEVFTRVLVPLDGSGRAEAALPYVKDLHQRMGSEVMLMQVVAPGKHVHTAHGLVYVRFEDQDIGTATRDANKYLESMVSKLGGDRDGISCVVAAGDPAKEILKYAAESSVSLIAMSSHGHSGIERWAFGSVTREVLQAGAQSVLVVALRAQS